MAKLGVDRQSDVPHRRSTLHTIHETKANWHKLDFTRRL